MSTSILNFIHRPNDDGSYDSVCKGCSQTVATSWSEAELDKGERRHRCAGALLRSDPASLPREMPGSRVY